MGGPSGGSSGRDDTDVSGAEAVATNYKYTTASSKKRKDYKPADFNTEKDDTLAKLDLFHNQGATNIKNLAGKVPSPALGILSTPLQAGSKKTREFFTDKVLTSDRGMKNLGYTKDEFSALSRTKQEAVYKGYLSDRQSGATDAYGNVKIGGGNDGRIYDPGTRSVKSQQQPKTASQMNNSGVKSDLITAKGPTSAEISDEQTTLTTKRKGRKNTILTSVTGDETAPTLGRKTLLG